MGCLIFPVPCQNTAERTCDPGLVLHIAPVCLGKTEALGTSSQAWLLHFFLPLPGTTSIILALQDSKPCQDSLLTNNPLSHLPS